MASGAQSKSLGQSTLNEKTTSDSCRSKPVGARRLVGEVIRRSVYAEKSPGWLTVTVITLPPAVTFVTRSSPSMTTRSPPGLASANVAPCTRTPPVMTAVPP